jgi:hypothetical protein
VAKAEILAYTRQAINVTLLERQVALVPASLLFSGSVVLFRSAQTRPVNQLPRYHHEPQVRDRERCIPLIPNIAWVTAEIDEI